VENSKQMLANQLGTPSPSAALVAHQHRFENADD
jgi:hypothetical protein